MEDVPENVKALIEKMYTKAKTEIKEEMTLKISNLEHTYDKLISQQRQTLTETFKLWIDNLTSQISQNSEFIGEVRGRATQFELQLNQEFVSLRSQIDQGVKNFCDNGGKDSDVPVAPTEVCVSDRNVTFSPVSLMKPEHSLVEMDRQIMYLTQELSKVKSALRDAENCIDKLEDQSRRNNLKFYGLPEGEQESWADSEALIRNLMRDELKIPDAENIGITRAHRMHQKGLKVDEPRPIIVKYEHWRDRQTVLGNSKVFKGTPKSISEDFCARTVEYRKKLLPEMYQKRDQGLFATIRYKKVISKAFRKNTENLTNEDDLETEEY